jgi:hypothetical protein
VSTKYTILGVRQKLSWCAARKRMTVYELLLNGIDHTFKTLLNERSIIVPQAQQVREDELHAALTKGNGMALKAIMYDLIKHRKQIAEEFNPEVVERVLENYEANRHDKDYAIKLKHFNESVRNADAATMFRDFEPQDFNTQLAENDREQFSILSDHRNYVRYKFKRLSLAKPLTWLKSILKISNLDNVGSGHLVVRLLLKRIELSKALLLLELENGQETLIPPDLGVAGLPKSFRYYTFLLNYIKEHIEVDKAEFFSLKKAMQRHFHRDGVAEGIDALYRPTEDSQAFRLTAVNKKRRKEIDHRYSNHALALQSSRYIQVKQSFQDIQN